MHPFQVVYIWKTCSTAHRRKLLLNETLMLCEIKNRHGHYIHFWTCEFGIKKKLSVGSLKLLSFVLKLSMCKYTVYVISLQSLCQPVAWFSDTLESPPQTDNINFPDKSITCCIPYYHWTPFYCIDGFFFWLVLLEERNRHGSLYSRWQWEERIQRNTYHTLA